jgi:hypothetical protein
MLGFHRRDSHGARSGFILVAVTEHAFGRQLGRSEGWYAAVLPPGRLDASRDCPPRPGPGCTTECCQWLWLARSDETRTTRQEVVMPQKRRFVLHQDREGIAAGRVCNATRVRCYVTLSGVCVTVLG